MFRLLVCEICIWASVFLSGCAEGDKSAVSQLPIAYRALESHGLIRSADAAPFGSMAAADAVPVRMDCAEEDPVAIDADDPPQCALLELESMGTTYRAYLLSRGHARLVIYHEGHCYCEQKELAGAICAGSERFMKKVLSYADVLFMDMPLHGINADQVFNLDGNIVSGCYHGWFSSVDDPFRSGLAYFVNPIDLFVSSLVQEYDSIDMVGRSGGGWTTTIYAALDRRIRKSISVAGTLPLNLRGPKIDGRDDSGDWEQHEAYIYQHFDYGVFYALAGSGAEGRYHAQIYNEFDSCCFSGKKGRLAAESFRNTYGDQLNVEFMVVEGVVDHSIPHDLVIELLFGDDASVPVPASADRTGSKRSDIHRINMDHSQAIGSSQDGARSMPSVQ